MKSFNIKSNNNYTVAEYIFDEIAVWQKTKNPKITLESLLGQIEKVLDQIENKNKILKSGCDCRSLE